MQKVRVVLVAHMMLVAQEKFPRTENFPKISLLKVENFQLQNFSDVKFVSANHILQNFLSEENFPELKWTFVTGFNSYNTLLFD